MSQLILQPDGTLGVDTYVSSVGATINFDAEIVLRTAPTSFRSRRSHMCGHCCAST